jgi:flagellar biosynthesis/type III secretory pathway protein FliH
MDDCSEKMKDFLDYVAGKNTTGELTNRLREEVERVKKSDRWRAEYMLLELNYLEKYNEGLEEGRKEGLEQGEAERKVLEEEIASLRAQLAEAGIAVAEKQD